MTRREFLRLSAGAVACGAAGAGFARPEAPRANVETVRGPVPADLIGLTLMHEHVLVDFGGAEVASPARYDADEVFRVALPYLEALRTRGCTTLVECTPAYLGRDVRLLRRLSEVSGLQILTNTGFYGANRDKHLPRVAFEAPAEKLAAVWIAEARDGIDGTGVRPAFMKIGVDGGPLSAVDAKLVEAAAIAHRETGLAIHSHTPDAIAASMALDLVEKTGVPAAAYVWVHAQSEKSVDVLVNVARRGAWIELDGVSADSVERHADLVEALASRGLSDRVLVSHDAGWYHVGEPGGGSYRGYDTIFTAFLPALRERGFGEKEVRQLLVDNPRAVLTGARLPQRSA